MLKSQKLLAMVFPVLLVVAVSGCTVSPWGGYTRATGQGVMILEWKPDFSYVESYDTVRFYLKVQNQGGEDAENVEAYVTNINTRDWEGNTEERVDFDDLRAPNPFYGTEGETGEHYFELQAPELSEGLTQTYKPGVRVYYDYKTTAVKPITIVNYDELRRLIHQGKTLETGPTTTSAGPLRIDVITGKYIKVEEDPIVPITIHIENTGGGVVYNRARDKDYLIRLDIDTPRGYMTLGRCSGGGYDNGEVTLWEGRETDVNCDLRITNPPKSTVEDTITITAEYGYYIDAVTSVTVKGKRLEHV